MTNKITPFCVDMTNKSDEQIKWLHDKCLEAGAFEDDTAFIFIRDRTLYPFMGVYADQETYSQSNPSHFNGLLITLDQVESHLGLTPDEVTPIVETVKWTQEMADNGVKLEVGMIALLGCNLSGIGKDIHVDYIGKIYVTYTPLEDIEDEGTCFPEALSPFPNEPTPEELRRDKVCKIIRSSNDVDVVYDKLLEEDLLK